MNNHNENIDLSAEISMEDEELPVASLKNEDKIKVIKGIILLFLFSSVVIYSLIYCNVPMFNTNILFSNEDSEIVKDFYFERYQVKSRHIHKNSIYVKLNENNNELMNQLTAVFIFSKNRMRLKITKEGKQYQIPLNMFESNDMNLTSHGFIDHVSESNIGIQINTNPFGFKLFRKVTNETLFNTIYDNDNNETVFKYDKDYMQLSTQLCNDHLTFGLGNSNSSLRITEGTFHYWYNWTLDIFDKSFLSVPNFISGNPITKNFYGSFMFSAAPMKIVMKNNLITYQISGGIIDLVILNGPKPRDIIIQLQKTFGMPFVSSLKSLNWQGNAIIHKGNLNQVTQIDYTSLLFPIKEVWIDDIFNPSSIDEISVFENGIEFIKYLKPIIDVTSPKYPDAVKSNVCLMNSKKLPFIVSNTNQQFCLIDQYNPNTTIYYNSFGKINKYNLVSQIFETKDNISFELPFQLNKYTIPLNSKFYDNSTLMSIHNFYSLKQAQNLYDITHKNGKRPIIFSQSSFIGSNQYTAKWLGYFENTWTGFKNAIKMTLKFNVRIIY